LPAALTLFGSSARQPTGIVSRNSVSVELRPQNFWGSIGKRRFSAVSISRAAVDIMAMLRRGMWMIIVAPLIVARRPCLTRTRSAGRA
jgi:hypothetical protein